MLAIRSLLRNSTQVSKNVMQKRNMSVTSVPARTKVSTGEIILLSGVMIIGWSAIPAWVLLHIKNYRDKN